ncbi:MAG: acetate--CoA ligase family protein [Syntrophorhabdaceae bacterium]|nr:acetate--CoA ligase family protein [Syntrophorhabdaceae bacterium]
MGALILSVDAITFLEEQGFPVLKSCLAKNEDEAADKAGEIGFPVTLKLSSPDVIHKTEASGIRVSLKDETAVREAFREIVGSFASDTSRRLDGVMVQEQGGGIEVIVGMLSDPQFGPVLMFGLGGIFVEAMKDVSFRLVPLGPSDAKDMLEELKGCEVLKNPRNGSVDLAAIESFLFRISTFLADRPEIREMDLNPVFVSSHGIRICDARIKIQ